MSDTSRTEPGRSGRTVAERTAGARASRAAVGASFAGAAAPAGGGSRERVAGAPIAAGAPALGAAVAVALVVATSPPVAAQGLPDGVTREMVEDGREIFADAGFCHTCHGSQGRGMQGLGGDLTDGEWVHTDGSFDGIVRRIREGVQANAATTGVPMPPRGGAKLSPEQIRAVAAYVWTLDRGGG